MNKTATPVSNIWLRLIRNLFEGITVRLQTFNVTAIKFISCIFDGEKSLDIHEKLYFLFQTSV